MEPATARKASLLTTITQPGSRWWPWTLIGALYGLALRLIVGSVSQFGAMSLAFTIATPIVVGALTIYGGRHEPQSIVAVVFRPWATVVLMLMGCGVVMLEGSICIALLAPLFLILGTIGGIAMALALYVGRQYASRLKAVAALPLLLLAVDNFVPLSTRELSVRQVVTVDADPAIIWSQILAARDIHADEFPASLTYLIGVPRPVEGINRETPEGEVRFSRWERGVTFQGVVTERKENELIAWRYRFDSHSFPAGSMDEHVAIGGRYFDLRDTTFRLRPLQRRRTELELVAHYRVTTSIGFYAVPAAMVLGNDFVHSILTLYKNRSERAARSQAPMTSS